MKVNRVLLLVAAAFAGLTTFQCEGGNTMAEENKALTRRFYEETINKGNVDAFDEFLSSDFIDHNPDPGQGPGREGLKQSFEQGRAAFPDLRLTIDDMIAEGDKVVTHLTFTGTHKAEYGGIPATGKQVRVTAIDIIRITGGKAVESWGLSDAAGMMQQLGVFPTPEQAE